MAAFGTPLAERGITFWIGTLLPRAGWQSLWEGNLLTFISFALTPEVIANSERIPGTPVVRWETTAGHPKAFCTHTHVHMSKNNLA